MPVGPPCFWRPPLGWCGVCGWVYGGCLGGIESVVVCIVHGCSGEFFEGSGFVALCGLYFGRGCF